MTIFKKISILCLSVLLSLTIGMINISAEDEASEPDTYHVNYYFVLEGDIHGDSLSELDYLLPTETEIPVGQEPVLPDYSDVNLGFIKFVRWDRSEIFYDDGSTKIFYNGVWKSAISLLSIDEDYPANPPAGGIPVRSGDKGSAGIPDSGVPTMTLGGSPAFCIEPQVSGFPASGTMYYYKEPLDKTIANIIWTGTNTLHASTAQVQDAVWDYLGHGHGISNWRDFFDESVECWGSVYHTYRDGSSWIQELGIAEGYRPLNPKLSVKKVSSATFSYQSKCSANYSLAGAIYGVYTDAACTTRVATLTTDANGNTHVYEPSDEGVYYVKEISPSKGFKLDTTVYPVELKKGKSSVVTSTEVPYDDPTIIKLTKISSDPNGYTQYLDTAEFTVRYYNLDPSATSVTGSPTITWVFKPEFDPVTGEAVVTMDKDHFVSGENTLWDDEGKVRIPIGIFTIEETLAPQTYRRDENVYMGKAELVDGKIEIEINGGTYLQVDHEQLEQLEDVIFLKTTAKFADYDLYSKNDEKQFPNSGDGTIIDTVEFENLEVGQEYVMKGKLMTRDVVEVLWTEEDFTNGDCTEDQVGTVKSRTVTEGTLVTEGETTFTPTEKDGTVDIEFTTSLINYGDKDLVCYEYLYATAEPDKLISYHADPEDDGQTVHCYKVNIGTKTKFDGSETYKDIDNLYTADGVGTLRDTVKFEDLHAGEEYTVKGKLYEREIVEVKWTQEDFENGDCTEEEIDTVKSRTVTLGSLFLESETTFTPEEKDGTVDVEFTFDMEPCENKDYIVYEYLYSTEHPTDLITSHEDPEDESQGAHIDPLYRAQFVLYKTSNLSSSMRLDGAMFKATSHRVKRDGVEVDEELGYFITGGLLLSDDSAFTLHITNDPTVFGLPEDTLPLPEPDPKTGIVPEVEKIDKSYSSSMNTTTEKETVIVTDLKEGVYLYSTDGGTTVKKAYISKGSIYLDDMAEDTEITWTEVKAPAGYYKLTHPYVTTVGHDYEVTVVTNNCVNIFIYIPVTGIDE